MFAFILVHLSCLAVFWTGITKASIVICVALYLIRALGVTAGYHRYFSHRSFKTSRFFQFILAWIAQSSTQKSVLWWADHHRNHHKYSDTINDVHSPRQSGFWYAHVAWIFAPHNDTRKYTMIGDFQKFPELRFLDRFEQLPSIVTAVLVWWFAGWPGLVVGFMWSTVLLYHATFTINSLSHVFGRQRYYTGDDSRNNPWLAIITLGEGWHNNHHHYPSSVRQGFYWWEYDVTYYVLKLLAFFKIVHDLHLPPKHAYETDIISTHNKKSLSQFVASNDLTMTGLLTKLESLTQSMSLSDITTGLQTCRELISDYMKKAHVLPLRVRDTILSTLVETDRVLAQVQQIARAEEQYPRAKEMLESVVQSLKLPSHPVLALFV